MARPKKQTVEYFPHFATSGKTLYILENSFGNDGYAFWFKLLELLANTDGHVLDTNNTPDWKFLVAKTLVTEEKASEILDMLAELNAVDPALWKEKVIWCQNLVDNVEDVYKKRRALKPSKPALKNNRDENPSTVGDSVTETSSDDEHEGVSDSQNRQSKVKESKAKETKGNNSSSEEKEAAPANNYSNELDPHFFYQNNIGVENPFISQSIEMWIEDLSAELVLEALKRAVIDQKGFKYAEGIMKKWDAKNIKTLDQVRSDDIAHANQNKKRYGTTNQNEMNEGESYGGIDF